MGMTIKLYFKLNYTTLCSAYQDIKKQHIQEKNNFNLNIVVFLFSDNKKTYIQKNVGLTPPTGLEPVTP